VNSGGAAKRRECRQLPLILKGDEEAGDFLAVLHAQISFVQTRDTESGFICDFADMPGGVCIDLYR
jgi:hypothetical protein